MLFIHSVQMLNVQIQAITSKCSIYNVCNVNKDL
jgi:hypothetical protein